MKETQETRKLNSTEVLLPSEIQSEAMAIPYIPSQSPMDLPVERFISALNRRETNRKAIIKWISGNLVMGTDFGRIHLVGKDKCSMAKEGRVHQCDNPRHWSKPSLWKPGAEKICGMLGLIARFPNLNEYENAVLRGEDIKIIILKCELHTPSDFISSEGSGARRIAQDNGDINKSLKMAEKSAHINATLRVAGLSEIFTQDLEDMTGHDKQNLQPDDEIKKPVSEPNHYHKDADSYPPAGENPSNKHTCEKPNQNPANEQGNGSNRITGKQYKFIMDLIQDAKMTKRELNEHCIEAYGCVVDHISRSDASSLIDWLRSR